jgi:plastocyanin
MRLSGVGATVAVVLTVGVACKSSPSGNGNGCKSTTAAVTIDARDNQTFSITSATISPGQTVCWENFGSLTHSITADATLGDSTWTSTNVDETLTPDFIVLRSGWTVNVDYPYHCRYHPSTMSGVIHVR